MVRLGTGSPAAAHAFRVPAVVSVLLHGLLVALVLTIVARAVPPTLWPTQSVQVVFEPQPAPVPVPAPAPSPLPVPKVPPPPLPSPPPPQPTEPVVAPNTTDVPPPPPPLPAPAAELPPQPVPRPAPPRPVPPSRPLPPPRQAQRHAPARAVPPKQQSQAQAAAVAPVMPAPTAPRPAAPPVVTAARPISGIEGNCQPDYPEAAQRRGEGGEAVLVVTVAPDGHAVSVTVRQSSGHPILDRAAVAKVLRDCRFYPATRGGVPIEGTAVQPMRFIPSR